MPKEFKQYLLTFLAVLLAIRPALPCSLCGGKASERRSTLRTHAGFAKLILYGKLANARLSADGGVTDLHIEKVLRDAPFLGSRRHVKIPRFVSYDPKQPEYIVFCDVFEGRLDCFRGEPASQDRLNYISKILTLQSAETTKLLRFYFDYLEHQDPLIAGDAFAEFAQAADADVGKVSGLLDPARFRHWLSTPKTPPERLGLYGFLLGACGTPQDAALLRNQILRLDKRTNTALAGLLCGLIMLEREDGWRLTRQLLTQRDRPLTDRLSAINAIRFFQGWKPEIHKDEIHACLRAIVEEGELADLAIEDLRRGKLWSFSDLVLQQYGRPSHAAPIVRQAIVRFALSSPRPAAVEFIANLRMREPDLVGGCEESLNLERQDSEKK